MKSHTVKKISKRFTNFAEEEQWLQSMINDGWILKEYDLEDVDACQYVFEPVKHEKQKNRIYKIDYRSFDKKDDYQEYKGIFEDSGWTSLSKNKWYSKHIFYTNNQNTSINIFSDQESYKEREKRKMSDSLTFTVICGVVSIIAFIFYSIYGIPVIGFAGFMSLITSVKHVGDYLDHKKNYKSFV